MALGTVNVGQPVSSDGQDYILAERIGQANGVAGLDAGGKVPAAQLPSSSTQDATPTDSGLMSAADKAKLDGVESGANKTTVDAAMSATSTNPVQNKVVEERVKGVEDKLGGLEFSVVDGALVITYDDEE